MFQLCEELDASRLFQSNWKIRRMFARVVADILASQSDRRGQKLAHRFCEPRLHTPQGILLLAEAATEHTRAAAKIGASTLRQLLSSRQPQVVWQLLKHWGRVSPILPAGVTLGDVINSDSALIRRRLLLTRLMKDRTSLSALRKLLREVNNLTEGKLATSSDVRFGNALVAWAELNTSIVVPTKRSPKFPLLRARDILSLNKHADHDVDFNARVAEAIELDCIERDQSRGVYHFHPNESFSEGRYGYTRNHVRRAISIVPRDRLGGLLEELLRCADEGVRWAVAAELQCWWVRLSEREIAVDIVFRLVEDEHPWIIREILQQLAKDPSLCDSLNPSSLILSAKTSRQAMSSAGWQIGELDSAMKRIGIASDAGD
jgi:hypothetical protein